MNLTEYTNKKTTTITIAVFACGHVFIIRQHTATLFAAHCYSICFIYSHLSPLFSGCSLWFILHLCIRSVYQIGDKFIIAHLLIAQGRLLISCYAVNHALYTESKLAY